ncbi:MAG: hypothetical protein WDM84_07020 [Bauldia sp.]
MSERLVECDVVVVGLGAAGGLAATILAESGLRVVGLEAGPRHSLAEFAADEITHESRNTLGDAKANHEVPTVRASAAEVARIAAGTRGLLMMNGLDGSKVHSTNVSWRMPPWNFEMLSATVRRYGWGAVPAGSALVDWPATYSDLEPFYDAVERRYGISGRAGNVEGVTQAGGNRFEGSRSRDYPLPPLRRTGYSEFMAEGRARPGVDTLPDARFDPIAALRWRWSMRLLRLVHLERLPCQCEGPAFPTRSPGSGTQRRIGGAHRRQSQANRERRKRHRDGGFISFRKAIATSSPPERWCSLHTPTRTSGCC